MYRSLLLALLFLGTSTLFNSCKDQPSMKTQDKTNGPQEVTLYTSDSIQLFGDIYELDNKESTILLFHQGGSNARGEYEPIIPKLIEKGFNVFAIDQRVGGQYYGNYNRTLANIPTHSFNDGYGYCDAYNNLEAALDYIIDAGYSGRKIIWGSSYSASLAIQLANNRQNDIDGVLAFSPASGGSMADCIPNQYFETIKRPLILLRPPNEMESENSKTQFELARTNNHQTFVPEYGVHGSSMLVKERVGYDVKETWNAVFSFLDEVNKE